MYDYDRNCMFLQKKKPNNQSSLFKYYPLKPSMMLILLTFSQTFIWNVSQVLLGCMVLLTHRMLRNFLDLCHHHLRFQRKPCNPKFYPHAVVLKSKRSCWFSQRSFEFQLLWDFDLNLHQECEKLQRDIYPNSFFQRLETVLSLLFLLLNHSKNIKIFYPFW